MTRWLGVALLPCDDDLRSALRVQNEVRGPDGLRPALSVDGNLPHVTVFQGPFVDSLDPRQELDRISASVDLPPSVRLRFAGIVYQATGWVFLSLERPPLLEKLQQATLAILDPLLDREAFDSSKDTSAFTDSEQASYARYGYRYTGDAYAPHITLGRAEDEVAREIVRSAPDRTSVPQTWTFDRLSFYTMGEQGAHSETLALWHLDPS
ncbi:2'-5' RNA ligase family protein [Streptomyces sp. B6B3]|uniref:2'-5' RNA ligase family protein n=1 Tax=Streptomyces sp. B6B3 TaxID=3153570 RepID=UPI00325D0872